MEILRKKERAEYNVQLVVLGAIIMRETKKNMLPLKNCHNIDAETALALGQASGQILHDEVIKLTENMSKEEIIAYLAQALSDTLVARMVDDKLFLDYVKAYESVM